MTNSMTIKEQKHALIMIMIADYTYHQFNGLDEMYEDLIEINKVMHENNIITPSQTIKSSFNADDETDFDICNLTNNSFNYTTNDETLKKYISFANTPSNKNYISSYYIHDEITNEYLMMFDFQVLALLSEYYYDINDEMLQLEIANFNDEIDKKINEIIEKFMNK